MLKKAEYKNSVFLYFVTRGGALTLLYIVKNISDNNIVIGKGVLKPGKEMRTFNLEPFKKMIDSGFITIEEAKEDIYQAYLNNNQNTRQVQPEPNKVTVNNDFVRDNIKQNLVESFFNLYLNKDVSDKELKMLKWFYKNIGFTNKISRETLTLLDEIETGEELIEVLINNIYPELLDLYLDNEREEQNK
jgi:hypothetical protein